MPRPALAGAQDEFAVKTNAVVVDFNPTDEGLVLRPAETNISLDEALAMDSSVSAEMILALEKVLSLEYSRPRELCSSLEDAEFITETAYAGVGPGADQAETIAAAANEHGAVKNAKAPIVIRLEEAEQASPGKLLEQATLQVMSEETKARDDIRVVEFPPSSPALPWLRWFDQSGWNLELPFSRISATWIAWILSAVGLVESISRRTVQRWLAADRIKPWRFHSWITPKDLPSFLIRAKVVLDLYTRVRAGDLKPDEVVYSVDEKTSIQARGHASYAPPQQGQVARLESSYERHGAVQLLAAINVAVGNIFARIVGDKNFDTWALFLADLILEAVAARKRTIHVILDNGSTHRPKYLETWLKEWMKSQNLNDVEVKIYWLPVRSSWLNQIEIFFSVLQRQALTPNNFSCIEDLKTRILGFINLWNSFPEPIKWTYTTQKMLKKFQAPVQRVAAPEQSSPATRAG